MLKRAWQHLHFARLLKKKRTDAKLQVAFHRSTLESIPVYCVTVWGAGCSAADKKKSYPEGLDINTAQKIIGCTLPSQKNSYIARAIK